ncbi:MAG: hypothetical protein KME19_25595 [Microcoleus vaginatus WJT46-NPBG5]|nr:hypothetical protein [Microcoleus vaginatus WJT46-NPBG5]
MQNFNKLSLYPCNHSLKNFSTTNRQHLALTATGNKLTASLSFFREQLKQAP